MIEGSRRIHNNWYLWKNIYTFIGSTVNILHKQTTICSEGVKNKTTNLYKTLFISGPPVAISHAQSIKDFNSLKCIYVKICKKYEVRFCSNQSY